MQFEMDKEAQTLSRDTLQLLLKLANDQLVAERQVDTLKALLKDAEAELKEIQTYRIPEVMAEAGINSVDTPTHLIRVTDELKVSISEKNKPHAHAWLRDNDHGDIIKNQVVIRIPAGRDEVADKVINYAAELSVDAERSESVHPGTLKAFCKEMQAQGEDLPEDLLGVFNFRKSKIKKV
jgi:hypothetical protein